MEKARYKSLKYGSPADGIIKVSGTKRRDMNAPTELERREKEFDIMREVQKTAARSNRLLALTMATIAFMVLWFIGAVAFWRAEQATGGQNWSYFEALYFTYVAQLTIGYGDFEPQTNSAKPTFVFWALIALPTLTVLIGSLGDNLSDFVNWATIWVGRHAGTIFSFFTSRMRDSKAKGDAIGMTIEKAKVQDDDDKGGFGDIANVENGSLVPTGIPKMVFGSLDLDAVQDAYRPFIMLSTAKTVLGHLDASPPRKYTYQEWVWLLKLLGEDESTADGHRMIGKPLEDGAEVAAPLSGGKDSGVWSWMGQESPLMSLEDDSEPKWVLHRLMDLLESELRTRGHRHVARDTDRSVEEVEKECEEHTSHESTEK